MATEQAVLRLCAPKLPFVGTVAVGAGPVGASPLPLPAMAGRGLLWAWRRGVTPGDLLLDGRQVLGLAATMTDPSIEEAVGLIGSHLGSLHDLNEQGIARLLSEIERFCGFIALRNRHSLALATQADAAEFIHQAVEQRGGGWRDPSVSTCYVRRSALRLLYRTARHLHLATGDPTLDIALPPRSARSTRPLEDDEEAIGRIWARTTLTETRPAAAWAIASATGVGSELAAVTIADLDLDGGRVWLHGSNHREPRWGELSTWALERVEDRVREIGKGPDRRLLTAATASRSCRQASVSSLVANTLTRAGLRTDAGVRPSSLSAWAGRKIFDRTGRIDEAAHALGIRSLDRAAETIGWDW